jgi:hypothetical protein
MITDSDRGLDFDAFLEGELRREIGALGGPRPQVGQAVYRAVAATGGTRMPLLSSLTAAASSKAAVGLATAALVIGGGTVAAAAASDSANPAAWGQTVVDQVNFCKSQLSDGEHGIGQCVSAKAKTHGQAQRDAHAADSAHTAVTPSPRAGGSGQEHPTGAPTDHPSGKPAGVPVGPPASPVAGDGSHPTGAPVTPPTPTPRHQ